MKTGSSFLDRLIERMDRLDPASVQTYVLRLVRDRGFLETIFNTIQEGVIVIDKTLKIRYINTAARNLLGILDDPTTHGIGFYLRSVDWARLLRADPGEWHLVSRQEIQVFYPVHRNLSFYLVPVKPVQDTAELPLAVIILHDVTKLRQDTEKTIESQKVQAITMLAASVAHELGNPLNSLTIHLQLLSRTLKGLEDPKLARDVQELLDVAHHEVERLDAIVHNFLQAIRPVPPKLKRIAVPRLMTESLEFMRQEIENRNILVQASLSENVPSVMGDADQLKQAFFNIIKNAIQSMPEGGVLRIACDEHDGFLHLRFADRGRGIPPEVMSRLMEPFFTTRPEGTGLGLLIVDRIVRSHGGELGIESSMQGGTVFTIRLPLQERQVRLLNAGENVSPDLPPAGPVATSEKKADG